MAARESLETTGQRGFLAGKESLVSGRFRRFLSVFGFAALVFLSFFPSLKNGFVNWDDDIYVAGNPDIARFSLQAVKAAFSSFYQGNYHPLTMLSYALEHHFFGNDPFVYHLTNLLLHVCAGLAALVFFSALLENRRAAWWAAFLFAVHPLRVESVAWISERKDVLCACFFIMALWAYLRYLKSGLAARYRVLSLACFAGALFSKAMAVSLPVVLLLLDYALKRRPSWQLLREKILFLALSCAFGLVALLAQHAAAAVRSASPGEAISVSCAATVFYLRKFVFPAGLSCLYPNVRFDNTSWLLTLAGNCTALAGLGAALWLSARYTRMIVFAGAFFLATLLPVLQFIPLGPAYIADRYSYIPSLGLSLIVALAFDWLARHSRIAVLRLVVIGLLIVLAAVSSVLTYKRCAVWKDSVVLWTDAVKKTRANAVALFNLGCAYADQGAFDRAVWAYLAALRIKPDYQEAYINLSHSFIVLREYRHALTCAEEAVKLDKANPRAYHLIGQAFEGLGRSDLAAAAYAQAAAFLGE